MRVKRTNRKLPREYKANRKLLPSYDVESFESDIEIWNKLDKRFRVLDTLTNHVINGSARSLICLLYTSPSPRDPKISRMPSSA